MRALVLSGGGSKASWQVGALRHLIIDCGIKYDIFCGNSAGALNAAKLATKWDDQEAFLELEKIWMSVTPDRIFRPWSYGFLGAAGGLLRGKSSAYNSAPLQRLIEQHISEEDLKYSGKLLTVGAVSSTTGEYHYFRETDSNIIKAIQASCAYPGAFLPIEMEGEMWIDAGVREFTPISEAIYLGAKEIDVIMLSNMQVSKFTKHHPNALDMARRALEIIMFRLDLWDLKVVTCEYEGVTIRKFVPQEDLGTFIDFRPENIRALHKLGYEDTKRIAAKYDL